MDITKRQTLKRIAGVTIAGTGFGLANNSFAANAGTLNSKHFADVDADAALSSIQVHTRLSATTNDIEVVITNTGALPTRITQMTPSQTSTKRGVFNFAKLMENGELALDAGQSVSVPMTAHPVSQDISSDAAQRAKSLTAALRSSFSVISDNTAFARVDVLEGIKLA